MELDKEVTEMNSDNLNEKNQEEISEISLDKVVESVEEREEVEVLKENIQQVLINEVVEEVESPEEILRPIPIVNEVKESEKEKVEEVEKVEKTDKEDIISAVKSQNKMLKIACVGLGLCTVLSAGLSIASFSKATNSDIFMSDMGNNRVTVQTVAGSDEKYDASTIYANNINSVVAIKTEVIATNIFGQMVQGASAGSGFVISEDGYILTNAHVVEDAKTIKIAFSDGKEYSAKLVGIEEENDVAILKIDSATKFKPVILGDSSKMTIGEEVLAVGNPLGELTFSMTKGIVSALDREIQLDTFTSINMFQVDCAVNQGNSGGPIFNMYGEVIGIVSAKYASETIEGLGFCIPTNDIVNIVSDLIEHGEVTNKAYMGVHVADVNETMIQQYNMVAGAYVSIIDEGSSAEKAGLKIGDIIVELDGKKVESVSDLLTAKRVFRAGDTAKLKVWRSGEYIDLKITFDEYVEEKTNVLEEANKQYQGQYNQGIPYDRYQGNNGGSYNGDLGGLEDLFRYYFGY